MKVLHIITRFVQGGADENTISTVQGLLKQNHEVDLIVGGESDFTYLEEHNGINHFVVPELKRDINPFYDVVAFWKIRDIIKKNKYDIVHTHTAKAGILGRFAAWVTRTPTIIHTLHGVTFHDFLNPLTKRFYIWLERITGCFTDVFITVGDDLKKTYINNKIGQVEKYVTIRSGMEIDKFSQAGNGNKDLNLFENQQFKLADRRVMIGTVARLEHRKGHIYLLKTASKIIKQFPNAKFFIVGDGFYREQLEEEAQRLGLTKNVQFLGFRKDIHNLLSSFDIFILTSLWEGLPRVLVQAAAAGKPIVTFDVQGANEVVKNGVNGFVVPVKDVEMLTRKIIYLIENPGVAIDMGGTGRRIVGDSWDSQKMIQEISELYDCFSLP